MVCQGFTSVSCVYRLTVIDICLHFCRKHKVWVKSEEIEIPGGKVEGPDMALEFVAVLTINNKEKVGHPLLVFYSLSEEFLTVFLCSSLT